VPRPPDRRTETVAEAIAQAEALARDVAPDLATILLTHHPDADTLDTLRPGETDLETAQAVARAVAAEMVRAGVRVLVQRADKAAFRRWMQGRDDTPEIRRAWVDRGRLLCGAAAFEALGLSPAPSPPRRKLGAAPGPIADALLAAFDDPEDEGFDDLAQQLLEAGRDDVLDLAIRKIAAREGEGAAGDLRSDLAAAAEGGPLGPAGWAELVALPVALPTGEVPDAEALAASLLASGAVPESVELRFLPGWRSPDALDDLSPGAVRRVLADLVAGVEPRDLPPGDTDELQRRGFGVLVGLRMDWTIQGWDEIAALGGLPEEPEEETPEEARLGDAFDRWRSAAFDATGGCVPLALVAPSEIAEEIEEFLEEAAEHRGLDEIREAVATARREAGSDDIVCRPEVIGDRLELHFYTDRGRFLDSLVLGPDELPVRADEMPRLLEAIVRLVADPPGR
jgi:hypothetical protein